MIKDYFNQLIGLWLHPVEFFTKRFDPEDEKAATRFSILTGILVALESGISEALGGGSLGIVALVTVILLVAMPFLVTVWIYAWTGFLKLCSFLLNLNENLDVERMRRVVAYSLAGLIVSAVGFGLGKWLILVMFIFQVLGTERVQRCSRWTAVVYVGLPFSLMAVLGILGAFMFKVFK